MAALTADRNTPRREGECLSLPVEASTRIWAGALTARNSSGNAVPASDTAGLVVVGRAEARADNATGSAGDITVRVREGVYCLAGSGITAANIGAIAFVADDQTVALSGGTNAIVAGIIRDVDGGGVWVEVETEGRGGDAQADSTASDVAGLKTDFNALLAKLRAARVIAS